MNFFEKVTSLIRAGSRLEDLGLGLARVLDGGQLSGFVFYGASERCLVAMPYRPAEEVERIRAAFEAADWRSRPREAFLEAFERMRIPTGEIGEGIRWAFLGPEDKPLGAFAAVRDPEAPPPTENDRKLTEFFFQFAGELAVVNVRRDSRRREAEEPEYLLAALNGLGRLMLERPDRARLLPSLLKIALDVGRTEVGSIILERDGRFITEVEWGLPEELLEGIRFLPEGQGIVEKIRETLEPVIVDDVSGPAVRLPDGFPVRIGALISIPLLAGDRLTGILNVATGEEGRELLASTVGALSTVAVLITSAVENVRLAEASSSRAQEAHQGLAEEKVLLRQILAGLREGILVTDSAGRIVLANAVAEEMLGLGGAAGRRFPERNIVTLRPFFAWLRERWAASNGIEDAEYALEVTPPAVLSVRIVPLRMEGDRFRHLTVIREESSGSRLVTGGTPAARVAAEIETPLAVVRVALAIIGAAGSGEEAFRNRMIGRGLERLLSLAEDLREEAFLEGGRPFLARAVFALVDAASLAVLECREVLDERRIICRGPESREAPPVAGDRRRIQRALARIISAAAGWTAEEGWMTIDVGPADRGVSVRIGFLQGASSQGFENWFPSDGDGDSGAAARSGEREWVPPVTGLAVACRVIELHGGRIAARSEKDIEGHLVVVLPAAAGTGIGEEIEAHGKQPAGSRA